MAATSKAELLGSLENEWAKLQALVRSVPAPLALTKDSDDTSIKDIIGHRAEWIALYLKWVQDGAAGHAVHMPAEGYKWNALKPLNAAIRAQQSDMNWADVQDLLATRKAALVALLETCDDAALYGGPMIGGNGKWTMGRYGESVGPSHFRSAAKYIRGRIRASGA